MILKTTNNTPLASRLTSKKINAFTFGSWVSSSAPARSAMVSIGIGASAKNGRGRCVQRAKSINYVCHVCKKQCQGQGPQQSRRQWPQHKRSRLWPEPEPEPCHCRDAEHCHVPVIHYIDLDVQSCFSHVHT